MKDQAHKTCDVVLGAVVPPRRRVLCFAGVGALALHLGGAAVAIALAAGAETPPARKVKAMVVVDHVIDLTPPAPPAHEEPPPPPPPPPPLEKPAPKPKAKAPQDAPAEAPAPEAPPVPENAPEPEKPPSEPPPAAQAAQVVAADQGAEGAFKVVSGSGNAYAGGTSSATGTGTQANHTGQVGTGNGNGYSKARAAQVASRNWPCGWPPEAEDLDVDQMFVTVKATIKPNGELGDIRVLEDPGYGFAKRVVWCARSKVRFDAALDRDGNPIEGETPPMRVKFERSDDF
ncbi:MAG TPA: hypothetical protein VI299_23775 [Polyangiales bacterium]